jgi:hypothetical protein
MANRAFFYIRVSTTQQGRSGLGIEAQRQALQHFALAEGLEVLGEYVEVETGKGTDAFERRPQLKAALAAARKHRCRVAVAKLDRLSAPTVRLVVFDILATGVRAFECALSSFMSALVHSRRLPFFLASLACVNCNSLGTKGRSLSRFRLASSYKNRN